MTCKHCDCEINPKEKCKTCENTLGDQCRTCHNEVAHGLITNQNIHIVGGSGGGWLDDIDAFKKSNGE